MGRWQTGSGMLTYVPARGLIDGGRWALLSKPVTPARAAGRRPWGGVGCAQPIEAVLGNSHVHVDTGGLAQCYSRCGLQTKNISLTWEFVSHAWAPPAKSGVAKIQTWLKRSGGSSSLLAVSSFGGERRFWSVPLFLFFIIS